MRALLLASEIAFTANSTTHSTPILLVAAGVGSDFAGDEAVPGEDMGFPSSGTAVVALSLEGVSNSTSGTVIVEASQNYYSDSGSGETFTTVATYTLGALTTKSKTVFLDRVPLGEAVRISTVSVHTADAGGTVSAYLLST